VPASIAFNGYTLVSAFQPIYSVRDGRASGYEGLARASGPEGQTLRPNQLFEGLDAAQIISLDRTCRTLHLRSFASLDPGDRMLYLNIHPVAAIADAELARQLRNRIAYFGLTPARVCMEILEGSCADEGLLAEAVAAFRDMGLSIAMDDFGVARSNFDRVAALRPDLVKIDRSILADAVGDVKARRMLPSVVEILHETGAKVVIEGIEDASAAMLAIESDADYLQGYYFATPSAELHDDALTQRIFAEMIRMPGAKLAQSGPAAAAAAETSAPAGALARLLKSARSLSFSARKSSDRETAVL